eukprot:7852-Chlamydomonas_euryale.AAC.1
MQAVIAVARHTSFTQVAWLLARKHLGDVYRRHAQEAYSFLSARLAFPSQIHAYMPGLQLQDNGCLQGKLAFKHPARRRRVSKSNAEDLQRDNE